MALNPDAGRVVHFGALAALCGGYPHRVSTRPERITCKACAKRLAAAAAAFEGSRE